MSIIFVAGIHGVGKTSCCQSMVDIMGIPHFTASAIIKSEQATAIDNQTKSVKNVGANQTVLINGVKRILKNLNDRPWLLDGHFCIWNINGQAEAIEPCVFQHLGVSKIIVFEDSPSEIHARLSDRDMSNYDVDKLRQIQEMELNQAQLVAKNLSIPVTILTAFDMKGFQNAIGKIYEQRT